MKEGIYLHVIYRLFGVNLKWLQSLAHIFWEQTPKDLGLCPSLLYKIKRLQVFGIQTDEQWSFIQKKANKRWIWVAYDPIHRLVIGYHLGGRGKKAAKKFWKKIPLV